MFCWFLTLKSPHVVNRTITPSKWFFKIGYSPATEWNSAHITQGWNVRPNTTARTLGPVRSAPKEGGGGSQRQQCCVQGRRFRTTETQAAAWRERLPCGKPDWASDTASVLRCTKLRTAKSFQSSQENERIVDWGSWKKEFRLSTDLLKKAQNH